MLRRLGLALAVSSALTAPTFAQTTQTSTGAPTRPAVVTVPSTGRNYPSNDGTTAQASGMVLLDPTTGAPYKAAGGGTSGSPSVIAGQNGTSAASTTNPVPVNNSQVNGAAVSTGNGTTDAGTQRVTLSSDSAGQVKALGSNGGTIVTDTSNRLQLSDNQVTTVTGGGANGTLATITTVSGGWVEFSFTAAATTASVAVTVSDDGTNYNSVPFFYWNNVSNRYVQVSSSNIGVGRVYWAPASGVSLRISQTGVTSGTTAGTAVFKFNAPGVTPVVIGGNVVIGAATTRTNGTITTANTFQSVLAANTGRNGCQVTNTSANPMTVDVGASPAAATARPLAAGATFDCSSAAGVVITDQINLTSPTAGSTFVVWSQ